MTTENTTPKTATAEGPLHELLTERISTLTSLLDATMDALDQYDRDVTGDGPIVRARDILHFAIGQLDDVRATSKDIGRSILIRRIA